MVDIEILAAPSGTESSRTGRCDGRTAFVFRTLVTETNRNSIVA